MVDIDLIVQQLRHYGHSVEHVHTLPDNAGQYEFTIDGRDYTLIEARTLLARDEAKDETRAEAK